FSEWWDQLSSQSGGTDGRDFDWALVGGDTGDTLTGGDGRDRIHGLMGADSITGGKGDDFLEGGSDGDTYIYNTGDGHDFIRDIEGANKLNINGQILTEITRVSPNSNIYEDDHGNTYVLSDTGELVI